MSVKAMGKVWELVLTPAKQSVLLAMADHADHDGGSVRPGVPYIAWKTGYSERQVRRIQRDLETDGILVPVKTSAGKPIEYHIDFSKGKPKPPFVPRKSRAVNSQTPDRMSAPDPGQDVTPDILTGRTSPENDDSQTPDIASAILTSIPLKDEPSLKDKSIAPSGAPNSETTHSPDTAAAEIEWVPGNRFQDDAADQPVALYACTTADINALIGVWWDWVVLAPTKRGAVAPVKEHFANKANREYARNLVQHGVIPSDFAIVLGDIRYNDDSPKRHLRGAEMNFCFAAAVVEEWVKQDRADNWYTAAAPRITPRKPGMTINLGEVQEGENLLERFASHPNLFVDVPPPYISPHEAAAIAESEAGDAAQDDQLLAEFGVPL